jgi:ubiquitin carboxyl-terminal hydrolase 25/28
MESDDFVIRKYKVFFEQSPAQKVQHRQKLFLIGHDRKSKAIMEQAVSDFSFEEACDYLQLEPGVKAGNTPDLAVLDYYVDQAVEVGLSCSFIPPTPAFNSRLLHMRGVADV